MTTLAFMGAMALFWMYIWLISAMSCAYISERKGYSDRAGLATGLVLSAVGIIVWLIVPAKPDSRWKTTGIFGTTRRKEPAA